MRDDGGTIVLDEEATERSDDEREPVERTGRGRPRRTDPRLYRVIWRWHFYAGLIVLPVLITAATTGGLYVFRDELERVLYPSLLFVEPSPETVPYADQIAAATAAAPHGASLRSVFIREDPSRATEVGFAQEDPEEYSAVYVDQHTGKVTGTVVFGNGLFDIVLDIHRTLFLGTTGRIVVELATSWGIILVVTGVYLWWPRGRKKAEGVWRPRVRGKAYVLWRDWHVVPGFYLSVFAFLIMGTGLFFTEIFRTGYEAVATATNAYPASYTTPPSSTVLEGATPIGVDDAIAVARRDRADRELFLSLPVAPEESYTAYVGEIASPSRYTLLYVDQYSGEVLDSVRWQQLSVMGKLSVIAYPIHVGSIYGIPTKILAVVTCLVIVGMGVTGAAMWWVRRPRKRTGFPRKPSDFRPAPWLILLICLLGVLMPAAGMSMIAILVGDWLLLGLRKLRAKPA